jgi:hypothetical protein
MGCKSSINASRPPTEAVGIFVKQPARCQGFSTARKTIAAPKATAS